MRLWSLHPRYLDRAGLTACWREGLLAKKVLEGSTKGYRNHPQLERFKYSSDPLVAINCYLHKIVDEAEVRGYNFDRTKLLKTDMPPWQIIVTDEQLAYEWKHLRSKHALRSPYDHQKWSHIDAPDEHPLFTVIPGSIASWERVT